MGGFESFVALLDTQPVYVVTAATDAGQRAGCLVGFAGQCSIRPPRFTVWISKVNHTYAVAMHSPVLAVHLLPQRHDLAELFGGCSGDAVDKFAAVGWRPGPSGVPVLTDALTWFVGRVLDRVDWGDHVGFLLDPIVTGTTTGRCPLCLGDVADIDAGHPA
ncbi:flavin reductase family protein [Streptomyces sp. CB01881]|uniref:flavin reductase family protein n=1 Tax=Streptomyces sp. CB01881 TaxID=2078691 RepID=UPI000CDC0540|nr:flavin reductase family protein [Streptomyces sp. CB01881]AUY47904.1 flavin oxidoreductase [Streptomyces sp. CB01881]TYC76379.1 flavin reductase [Streptomyces sp. CB01881]